MESNNLKTKRIAIIGGSFDPPTLGHMKIACEVYNNISDIDEVWISPCGNGRNDKKLKNDSKHRVNMLNIIRNELISPELPVKISTIEIEKNDYIPTYYFLCELKEKFPDCEFIFCIGSDLIKGLINWDEGEKLMAEFKFIIFYRKSYPLDEKDMIYPKNYELLDTDTSASSTEIRARLADKKFRDKIDLGISGLTSKGVIKYIIENKLFGINQ